jgi:hypothetical protein
LFGRGGGSRSIWKTGYEDTIYKVYDWNKNLAGYFFPKYDMKERISGELEEQYEENNENGIKDEDTIIENMNKSHKVVRGGNLMVPMVKLNLLDKSGGIDLNYAINSLQQNLQRMKKWEEWLEQNHIEFKIIGSAVYTAREDRNMLSIVVGIDSDITLGEKEVCVKLTPILNRLHEDGML